VRGILKLGELCENILRNSGSSLQHVIVPVPGYSKTFCSQDGVPCRISLGRSMLAAVDLDEEALFKANEMAPADEI
jgi:hypothetical protein